MNGIQAVALPKEYEKSIPLSPIMARRLAGIRGRWRVDAPGRR
jgi:hypothetical protein